MNNFSEISRITGLAPSDVEDKVKPKGPSELERIVGGNLPKDFKPSAPSEGTSPLDDLTRQIDLTNVYTDPLSSYTKYGVPLNPFVDWNEERAQRQSTGQKWAHGLAKAGITLSLIHI